MALKHSAAFAFALLTAPVFAAALSAAPASKELGVWYDDTGDGAINIEPCGDKLCGKLVWLKEPLNDKGQALFDRHNPDESKRKRPICGLPIFGDLKKQADGSWDSGWVYDPHEGKSYSFTFALAGADKLQVTGYLGMKLLGKTMTWTRAPGNLPSCAAQPAAATPPPAAKPAAAAPAVAPAAIAPAVAAPAKSTAQPAPPASPPAAAAKTAAKPAAPAAATTTAAAKPRPPAKPAVTAKKAPAAKPVQAGAAGEPLPWTAKTKTAPAEGAANLGGPAYGR